MRDRRTLAHHKRTKRKSGSGTRVKPGYTNKVISGSFVNQQGYAEVDGIRQDYTFSQWNCIALDSRPSTTKGSHRLVTLTANTRPVPWASPTPYFRTLTLVKPLLFKVLPSGTTPDALHIPPYILSSERFLDGVVQRGLTWGERQDHFIKFNEKLADRKVDVLTALGEAKSSISMVSSALSDLMSGYKALRKGKIGVLRKLFKKGALSKPVSRHWRNKTVENRYLEYTYGWSPMIGDIVTAFKELSDQKPLPQVMKVSHSTKLRCDFPSNYTGRGYRIMKTNCYFAVRSEKVRRSAEWNLINNPLLTAWELVPYSFVVDWFIPIGDTIGQFSAADGLDFISGTTTQHTRAWWMSDRPKESLWVGMNRIDYQRTLVGELNDTYREVHTSRPIGFPTVSFTASVRRTLNGLALLSQRFRR